MEIEDWNAAIEAYINSSTLQVVTIAANSAGTLTVLGAGYIVQDIVKDADRRKPTRNRIMLFMSSCDLLNAFVNSVLGSVMIPKEIGVPGAVGNEMTCDAQGFLAYASAACSSMLNVSLALCYVLTVCYEYSDERLHKIEPYFLYIPLSICLSMAIPGLPFGIYNFDGYTCIISVSPFNCDKPESPIECERGELYPYWLYWNSFLIFIEASVIIYFMIKMYTAVLHREQNGDRFRVSRSTETRRTLSNTMRSQGLWYSGAFVFTFVPMMIFFIWRNFYIHILSMLTFQLIGFTNAVIYVRPRFIKFRRDFPNLGVTASIWYTLVRKRPARVIMTSTSRSAATTASSSSTIRDILDRLSSGMKSFVAGVMRSIVMPSGEREHPSDALASAEKDDIITSSHNDEEVNKTDDEKRSAINESEEGHQHEEMTRVVAFEQNALEINDGTVVQTNQGTPCMEETKLNDSDMVLLEDQCCTATSLEKGAIEDEVDTTS